MSEILVLFPGEAPLTPTAGILLRRYTTAKEVADALRGQAEAVLAVGDALSVAATAALAEAVAASAARVIEVRSAGWDGQTPSALSAACRGVISGFGDRGVVRAVELLQRERAGA